MKKNYIITIVFIFFFIGVGVAFATPSAIDRITDHIQPLIKTDSLKVNSTATSSFSGGLEVGTKIGAPYFFATSTTATSTLSGGLSVTGGLKLSNMTGGTNCVQFDTNGNLTQASASCGTGAGGASYDWQQVNNNFNVNSLTPTTTIPIFIKSTATSTFKGDIQTKGLTTINYLTVPSFQATSTTASSTIAHQLTVAGTEGLTINKNGTMMLGNSGNGGNLWNSGLFLQPTQFGISTSSNDLVNGLSLTNTNPGIYAATCISLLNGATVQSVTPGVLSTYFGALCFSGHNFAAYSGLQPNGVALLSSDGGLVLAASSANAASSSIAFGSGSGYTVGNFDMILKTGSDGIPRLGIGSTTPAFKLSVSGNASFGITTMTAFLATSTASSTIVGSLSVGSSTPNNASAVVDIFTTGSNKGLVVSGTTGSTGNIVEINGPNTPNLLRIVGNGVTVATFSNGNGNSMLGPILTPPSVAVVNTIIQGTAGGKQSGDLLQFKSELGGTRLATFNSRGWLGIGTSTPQAQLSVVATSTLSSNQLFGLYNNYFAGKNASSTLFVVDTVGRSGFGTDTPYAILGVMGTSTATTTFALVPVTSQTANIADIYSATTTSPVLTDVITAKNSWGLGSTSIGADVKLVVNGKMYMSGLTVSGASQAGNLCISAGGEVVNDSAACLVSSLRFKEKVKPLSLGLDELLKLKPVSFYYKPEFNGALQDNPNYNGEQVGFIAEDVQKIAPDLVTVETSGADIGKVHSVRYQNITALITQAIQDFYKEFQTLLSKVSGLEKRLDSQQNQIDELRAEIKSLKK